MEHDQAALIEAFEEAFASLRIEGIEPTEYAKEQARRVVRGDLTFEQALEEARKRYSL